MSENKNERMKCLSYLHVQKWRVIDNYGQFSGQSERKYKKDVFITYNFC